MKTILLISPHRVIKKGDKKRIVAPFSLMYIAGYLEKNNFKDIKIVDVAMEGYDNEKESNGLITYGLGDDEIKRIIREEKPDIIGVSMSLSTYSKQSHHICQLAKEVNSDITVIVGGIHASALPEDTLKNKNIDLVVIGEGEKTFLELVQGCPLPTCKGIAYRDGDKIIITEKREPMDINELPFPTRHLLNMEKYITSPNHYYLSKDKRSMSIMTSRGCVFHCSFCSSNRFFGKWEGVLAEKVIEEIDFIVNTYHIDEIHFEDDNMITDRTRAIKIFNHLKKLNISFCFPNGIIINFVDEELLKLMKEAGCHSVIYGIEVGNKDILHKVLRKPLDFDKCKKKIELTKKLGIFTNIFLMVGVPKETKENMKETFAYARYLEPDNAFVSIYNPLVGSELYDLCVKNNYINKDYSPENCLYEKCNITTEDFSSEWLENFAMQEVSKLNLYLKLKRLQRSFIRKFTGSK